MLLLRTILSIVILAFLQFVAADIFTVNSPFTSSAVRRVSLKISLPQTDFREYLIPGIDYALDDDGVYYARCRNSSNPEQHLCDVVRETPLGDGEMARVRSCSDVPVPVDDDPFYLSSVLAMIPLSTGHVALITEVKGERTWTIVNLLNCSGPHPSIVVPLGDNYDITKYYLSIPIVFRHHFETIMKSAKNCNTLKSTVCRVRYQYSGGRLTPKPIKMPGSTFVYTVQPLSDAKGIYSVFVLVDDNNYWSLNITYTAPSGESRLVASDMSQGLAFEKITSSVHHELLSICWLLEEPSGYIRCLQTNTHKALVNATVKVDSEKAEWLIPFSLPDGMGMLLAETRQAFDASFRIRWLRQDGKGTDEWLKVVPGWTDELGSQCNRMSFRGTVRKYGDEICINVSCARNVDKLGWNIQHEKVCLFTSYITDALS